MTEATVTLRRARPEDLEYVEDLLDRNGLPVDDVRSRPEAFYVAFEEGEPVGIGGLEIHGSDALLRSVVVEERMRGEGHGSSICASLESEAAAAGVDRLYLLTTTASGFFDARGYDEIDRSEAPAAIRETEEFADLCPDAATCMRTSL